MNFEQCLDCALGCDDFTKREKLLIPTVGLAFGKKGASPFRNGGMVEIACTDKVQCDSAIPKCGNCKHSFWSESLARCVCENKKVEAFTPYGHKAMLATHPDFMCNLFERGRNEK